MERKVGTQAKASARVDLNIVYRRIEDLKPDPANPRRHTKRQIRQIAESIKAFGFNVPILIDRDGNIIAGHSRYGDVPKTELQSDARGSRSPCYYRDLTPPPGSTSLLRYPGLAQAAEIGGFVQSADRRCQHLEFSDLL